MDIFISPLIPQVQRAVRREAPPLSPSSRSFSTTPSPPPARHPITAQTLTPSTRDSNPRPPRPTAPQRAPTPDISSANYRQTYTSVPLWQLFLLVLVHNLFSVVSSVCFTLPFESTEKRKSHFVKKMADGLLWQHELYICSWITTGLLPLQMNTT